MGAFMQRATSIYIESHPRSGLFIAQAGWRKDGTRNYALFNIQPRERETEERERQRSKRDRGVRVREERERQRSEREKGVGEKEE